MSLNLFELAKSFVQPEGEGWAVFNLPTITPETKLEEFLTCGIEYDFEDSSFDDDQAAVNFVTRKANAGSAAHVYALRIHNMCNDIRRLVWGPEYVDSRLGPAYASEPQIVALQAPDGTPIVGTFERLTGCAHLTDLVRHPDGKITYEYTGNTEVHWDDQETATHLGNELFVDENGNIWLGRELIAIEEDQNHG